MVKRFSDACSAVGKKCTTVVDWEGKFFSCDLLAFDGSRAAVCYEKAQVGWHAYSDTENERGQSTEQDQECALLKIAGGAFMRWGGRRAGTDTFKKLCESLGRSCQEVRDWENTKLSCNQRAFDGTRIARCQFEPAQ